MMNPSVHLAEDGNPSGRTNPTADDDTVITPTRGEKTRSNNGLKIEKTIKFRFVPPRDKDGVHPAILHAHWMYEVTKAFGEDVKFFDNRNRIVGKVDPLRTNPEEHTLQFQLHFDRHTTQHRSRDRKENSDHLHVTSYIVHRIQTSVSLGELKEAANVIKLMKDHDFYVNEHRWSEADWETTQLGFLYGIDPQFHDIDQATIKVTKTIQQSFPRTKVPKFKLVYPQNEKRKWPYCANKSICYRDDASRPRGINQASENSLQGGWHFCAIYIRRCVLFSFFRCLVPNIKL
ncbi:hypothetical protein MHU86_23754 [Fragilaria crotonensis]|nr:hypothetical protein MHU86_23754 [Fragilaria crotonensis]